MNTFEFEPYKVDHLFLLIGENPLPNYVAAKLLLKKDGTAYLVYSTNTEKSAKRLQTILKSEFNGFMDIELRSLNDYESDAYYIQEEIKEKLGSIKSGKIGLNYTGGTKAMSAHSYRALFYEQIKDQSNTLYKRREDITFSYLDPRRLEMCIDREENERVRLKIKSDTLQLKLEKIFELHELKLGNTPIQEVQLAKLAQEIAQVFADEEKYKQWFNWYSDVFCTQARNSNREWISDKSLANLLIDLKELPQEIIHGFEQSQLLINYQLALKNIKNIVSFQKVKHFCKWLDGEWLEHYVLQQIKDIANKESINNYGLNFKIPLENTDGFQFDIAFTRGYQLFAISCTTDSQRPLCKSKLFEAHLRAQQMGGDEARVALVCCFNDPESLKAEVSRIIPKKKIAVFGREHLKSLATELSKWIQHNDKETK